MSSVTLPQVGKQEMLNQERGCGDKTVPHADHVDYLVNGRLHHPHGDHCDDHGSVQLA
jgi:hypothetical protein